MTRLRGFTLIEIIVAMGISSILALMLVSISIQGFSNYSTTFFAQGRDASFLQTYSRVNNYVRVAMEFPSSYTNGSTTYSSGPTTLIMKLQILHEDQAIACNFFDYVIYTLDGSNLREIVYADSQSARDSHNTIVTKNVSGLTFTQNKTANSHRIVGMTIEVSQVVSNRPITSSHSQEMVARND